MPAQTVEECVALLNALIEEAQHEANCSLSATARHALIAKRDALTEAKLRIRDGARNPAWTRLSFGSDVRPRH